MVMQFIVNQKSLTGLQDVNRQHASDINVCETLTRTSEQVIFDLMVLKCDERGFELRF